MSPRWTPQEDAFVIQAYEDRMRAKLIAEKLGRSYFSVKAKIASLGITGRAAWTRPKERKLRDMWLAGEKISVIAATIGRTDEAVRSRRRELGLPTRHKRAEART